MHLNLINKNTLYLLKPFGWLYVVWKYKLPKPMKKFREIAQLTYRVLTKGNNILVVYTKDHPIFNNLADHAPEGVLFIGLTSVFKKNLFLDRLISKVDVIYEDGANPLPFAVDRPIVKYFEHPHFKESRLKEAQIKKIFLLSQWAKPNHPDPEQKMEVLYPSLPITPHKWLQKEKSQITILLAGAAAACKGADIVYYAFEKVEAKFPDKKLFLIMAANYKATASWYPTNEQCQGRLHDIYRACQKKKNVYFSGIYPPSMIRRLYEEVDIYVQPSRFDSFGFAVMEAISYGLPVITTTINAFPEMIEHGRNGFLIETQGFDLQSEEYFEYAVNEMENYLTQLVENPDLRRKMGEESEKIVQTKFNLAYQKNRLKTLFQEILAEERLNQNNPKKS